MYDYVIVGGGPTGLTLATYLPGRIALIERHPMLGGCHRANPSAPRFVEHGPRVYSGAYVNVQRVLRDIGVAWDDAFVPTAFSPELIDGKRWYQWLSPREISLLSWDYVVFAFFDKDHGKRVSMKTYCLRNAFSAQSTSYIDAVCRFSDGAGAARYTLWEFVSGFDQHIRSFYLPRQPNHVLFAHWHRFLQKRGVDVHVSTAVTRVTKTSVACGDRVLRARKVILAVPPHHASQLLEKSKLSEPRFKDFAKKTKYDIYWSVSFFGTRIDNAKGHATTPWGIIAMQYPFEGVVSAAASVWDVPSPVTGKTLAQTTDPDAVAKEIRRQLGFDDDVEYAYQSGPYQDQAFVAAAGKGYVRPKLACGVYTVGTHNGESNYNFTSMESAVQNALVFAKQPVQSPVHASDALRASVLAALGVAAVLKFRQTAQTS
jgi:hypothetical protein